MTASAIPADSTSYPTLAVIIHQNVTDRDQKTAIGMLSWRMFQFLYQMGNAGVHPSQDTRQGPEGCQFWYERLSDLISAEYGESDEQRDAFYERLDMIVGHLITNHERSIKAIKAGAV